LVTQITWTMGEGTFSLRYGDIDGPKLTMRVSPTDAGRYVHVTDHEALCLMRLAVEAHATTPVPPDGVERRASVAA
jgi:hypothetical protein